MEIVYKNAEHERSTHLQYKDSYCIKDDLFERRYLALTKNLDIESIKNVDQILKRIQQVLLGNDYEIDLFNQEEKRKIEEIQNNFYKNIYKVSEDVYQYKNYILPEYYFEPNVFYYKYGCEFFCSIEKIKNSNIIDAGAFIGDSTLLFSKMTCGTVFAFEALEKNCEKIKKTIILNNSSNIKIVNKAIGKTSCYSNIEENETTNWSTMKPYKSRKYRDSKIIQVQSIDDYIKDNGVHDIGLIKLHIEGMEFDAIQGAERTLCTQKPALIIHIHHTPDDFWNIKPYIESLNLGYRFKIYKPVNGNVFTGTMLLAEVV